MSTDLFDNGDAAVLVLPDGQGRLDAESLVLPGGGTADVFIDDDGDTLVQVDAGRVRNVELLRAVLKHPALTSYGDLLDLVVATTTGSYDRWVLTSDLEHRLLFSRQWAAREDDGGPVVTLVGPAPSRAETDPDLPDELKLHQAATSLVADSLAPPAKLHVVDLFTRRGMDPSARVGGPGDARADGTDGPRAQAIDESHVVLAAWGPIAADGAFAVEAMVERLKDAHDGGKRIVVRGAGGEPATQGSPAQPSAAPDLSGAELMGAPTEWLYGGELG